MKTKIASATALLVGFGVLLTISGCTTQIGPSLGMMAYPIPVSPFFQKAYEDEYHNHKFYDRAAILGPITAGCPTTAMDAPSDDEVMRALEKARGVQGGIPLLDEVQRNNVRITTDLIADYVDPPRVYPLVGPAQLHHAQYKCTIYFTEVHRVGWPIPYTNSDKEAVEVIYVDHDHLHMVGNVDPGPGTGY